VTDIRLKIADDHRNAGRLQEAAELYQQILQTNPNEPQALSGLAILCYMVGQLEPAAQLMGRAVQVDPNSPEKRLNFSAILAASGKFDEATAEVRQALALKPQFPEAYVNLGNLLSEQNQLDEAIAAFRRAVQFAPQFFEANSNLGTSLMNKGENQEALIYLRRAQSLRPSDPTLLFNLAITLQDCGQYPESQTCYQRSIQLDPSSQAAHVNYAVVLHAMGKSDLAWQTFFQAGEYCDPLAAKYPGKRWPGGDPSGKTILVYTDDHFGDSLLLARFAPLLKQRGANVILQCKPPLMALFQSLKLDAIVPVNQDPPAFDAYAPLWALPFRMGFGVSTIPRDVPYLAAPGDRVQKFAGRIPSDGKKNIGIVWAGSESVFRSKSLDLFAPLAAIPASRFFSLQKGRESGQKPPAGMEWIDYTAELTDFADTAALIQQLDLVISVDTAVAHLAGALGKPTWVLIPRRCNYFWAVSKDDSPWYPTIRLFREEKLGDWTGPIEGMAKALADSVRA
jgi:tetratricopeptide (TPR) repeat protein